MLDVGGVGYGLSVSSEDFGRSADGKEAKFYVYEHIREQGYDLFGFSEQGTKSCLNSCLA